MRRWAKWRWPTRGEWLLVGVILLVFVLDVVQQSVVLVPFFFVPLVAAAAVEGPRVTAALSVLAMALVLVSGVRNGYVLGVDFWVRLTAMTMFAVLAVVLAAMIERRQRLLRQLRDEERRDRQRLAAVFEFSPTPAIRLSAGRPGQTRVLAVNDALKQLMGIDLTGAATAGMQALIVPEDRDIAEALLTAAAQASAVGPTLVAEQREVRLRPVSGGLRWMLMSASAVGEVDADGHRELVLQLEDITARRQAEQALTVQALTDEVTGLPNRYALTDRLARALARLSRQPGLVCVLFCDLDQFKQVNDRHGHQVGDLLLQEVALRLKAGVRPDDTVARLGGDEFIVVYEGVTAPSDAILMALRLQDRVRQPWVHDGVDFTPTLSVGVAATADPNASIDDLLRRADIAMYRAKDTGRDRVELYDRSLDGELAQAVAMQQQLRQALREDGLVLHYQPVVALSDGSITGAEALLRMRGPDGTLICPDRFLPHAEASGLIAPVGAWVLQRALADIRDWHRQGLTHLVSVNVSPTELRRPGFARLVPDLGQISAHPGQRIWARASRRSSGRGSSAVMVWLPTRMSMVR